MREAGQQKCRQEGRRAGIRWEGRKVYKDRQAVAGPVGRTFKREV